MKVSTTHSISHGAKGKCTFTYDTDTLKVTAKFVATSGYFAYFDFHFYVFFGTVTTNSSGEETFKKKSSIKIGGLHGTGNNIWYSKTFTKSNVKYGTYTHVAFGYYCSTYRDSSYTVRCVRKWDKGPTVATKAFSLIQETVVPDLIINADDAWDDDQIVSKYTNKMVVKWTLPSSSPAAYSLAAGIYNTSGTLIQTLYSTSSPQTFSSGKRSGTLTFSGLTANTNYRVRVAVASSTENITTKWNSEYAIETFKTLEAGPTVTFYNAVSTGSTATVQFKSMVGSETCPLAYLTYELYDDTYDVPIEMGIALQVNENVQEKYTGSFTLTGLIAGHTYTVTPIAAETYYDGVGMAKGIATQIFGAVSPAITSIYNSGSSLIFGEPNGNPCIYVGLTGTTGVWTITLKIGTSISNGVVSNPVATINGVIGTNTIMLTDAMLDAIYKTINTSSTTVIYASIEYKLTSNGGSAGSSYKSATMVLKGNAKTSRVGVNGVPKRAKVWVGVNGVPKRAVSWVGVNGVPKRSL